MEKILINCLQGIFDCKLIKVIETRNQSMTAANYYANAAFKSTHSRDAIKKIVKQKISSRHIFMDRWEKKNRGNE